jgi:hypothetical protein
VIWNAKARSSRRLGTVCFGVTLFGLTVAACNLPEFEFPPEDPAIAGDTGSGNTGNTGNTGSGGDNPVDHCSNGLFDEELGESDFDCGGGCEPCDVGQHCVDVADCLESICQEGTCLAAGCVNGAQDGTETDVDCGGGGCGACITGKVCHQASDCASGVCSEAECLAPACDDQVENGKETALDCGGGCPPCAVDQRCVSGADCQSGDCTDDVCGPECPDGFVNCDKKNDNACEVNTRLDPLNCGECANACDLAHATAECSAGECRIASDGCDAGYADCNGLPEDGCEVNLKQDKLNCGACNKVCPEVNGAPFCDAAACQITCAVGYADCDDKRNNGCEKDLTGDVKNCGECKKECLPQKGGTVFCKDDTCGETVCPTGFGDCNGDPDDGCEIDLRIDPLNCGSCRNLCVVANGTAGCSKGVCQVAKCDTGHANCTGGYDDGCETNTQSDTGNCGGCGKVCHIANGTPSCNAGSCAINNCGGTFRDCDGSPSTGCEVNIATSTLNCGGCGAAGQDCSAKYAHATSSCSMSACTTPVCLSGYGDCAGGLADGCETNTTNNPTHCGGCNLGCTTEADAHVSSNSCSSSVCSPACDEGWATCSNPRFGCTTQLGTVQNCSECGEACGASAPYCDPSGCVDHRDIVVVNSGAGSVGTNSANHAIAGWNGSGGSASELTVTHTLGSAKNGGVNNRMVIAGIIASDTFLDDPVTHTDKIVVTYNGVAMKPAVERVDSSKQSYAGIYYILDADLPNNGNAASFPVKVQFAALNQWGHGGIDVVELKNAMQVAPIATGSAAGSNCSVTQSRAVSVTFSQTGSFAYGVMSARAAPSASLTTPSVEPSVVETWDQHQTTPADHTGNAAYANKVDSTRTFTWDIPACYNSAGVAVAIKRLSAN